MPRKSAVQSVIKTIDKKRSLAAKKGAATRALNREQAEKRAKDHKHFRIMGASLIAVVILFTGLAVKNQLDAYAAADNDMLVGQANRCVDNNRGKHIAGNKIIMGPCDKSASQRWNFTSTGQIRNGSSKWCLGTSSSKKGEYTILRLYKCTDSKALKVTLADGAIISTATKECLTVYNDKGATATTIRLEQCVNPLPDTQKWKSVAMSSAPSPAQSSGSPRGNSQPTYTDGQPEIESESSLYRQYSNYPASLNYSGYATHLNSFQSVEGKTKVPKLDCSSPYTSDLAAWVGFDGVVTDTVEQTGIHAKCMGNNESKYYAWYMMYGSGSTGFFNLAIKPGDVVFYKVSVKDNIYTMSVSNQTTGKSESKSSPCVRTVTYDTPRLSHGCTTRGVEWVIERPGFSALAPFGKMTMYDNYATDYKGVRRPINDYASVLLEMHDSVNTQLSKTGSLGKNGAFDLTWVASGRAGQTVDPNH